MRVQILIRPRAGLNQRSVLGGVAYYSNVVIELFRDSVLGPRD